MKQASLNTHFHDISNQQRLEEVVKMRLSEKQISIFLFVAQGVGAIFVSVFLAAYLGGLPSTAVLHSEPAFRIPLYIFGVVLLVMVLTAAVLGVLTKKG